MVLRRPDTLTGALGYRRTGGPTTVHSRPVGMVGCGAAPDAQQEV